MNSPFQKALLIKFFAPRPGVTLPYRVNEGVPEVQSSGVRGAGCARAPTTPATAATALEPQIYTTLHTHTITHACTHTSTYGTM